MSSAEMNQLAKEKAPLPSRPKMSKKKVVVKRPPKKSKWNADNILSDPKSPLAKADLRTALSNPMAWEALDKEEKEEILSLFPDNQHILAAGTDQAQPDFISLMNDDSFRHDCAAYVENIAQGRHDVDWLAAAWSAHERRKTGDFDEHLINKFEDEWEVEIPTEMKPSRAVSGGVSITLSSMDEKAASSPGRGEAQVRNEMDGDDQVTREQESKSPRDEAAAHEDEIMKDPQEMQDEDGEQKLPQISQDKDSKMDVDETLQADEMAKP